MINMVCMSQTGGVKTFSNGLLTAVQIAYYGAMESELLVDKVVQRFEAMS